MHTTIRHYEGVSDTGEVVRQLKEENFLDEIRAVQGFVNYSVIDAGDALITISTFEDRSGAEESNRRAAEFIRQHNLGSLIPNRPRIAAGEVAVHESR
jgi:hypothetical protein